MLKKDFKQKDIQHLRNLVQGKTKDKTTVGVGYEKAHEFHEEGDVWKENGKSWTIKNGIKQNITKLDKAKQLIMLPLFCPSCNILMKHKNDKLFYLQYNRCFNCQIDFETELKILGLWEKYEQHIINSDIDNLIKDYDVWVNEIINTSNENFIAENGDVEQWNGSVKKKLLENKEETIKYLQNLKKQ